MDKKLLKPEMDTNKTVKDSRDTRKMEKLRSVNYINKGVSERGDSKTVFINRIIEQKTDNKEERTKHAYKKSDEVRTQQVTTQIDKTFKLDNKFNEARLGKLQSINRKQESVAVFTRKSDTQNTTKDRDIVKRSDGKDSFKTFPRNNERKPITIADKDVKFARKQTLTVMRKYDPQNLSMKYNTKRSDANEMSYGKEVNLPSKEELANDISARKPESQNMTVKDYITKKSNGKESTGNSPLNAERKRNIVVNDYNKDKKMPAKQELVTGVLTRKSESKNMTKKAMHITIKLDGKESTKNYQVNKEIDQNSTANVCDDLKMPSKQEIVNKFAGKYDLENINNNVTTTIDGQQINKSNKCGRNSTVNINNKDTKMPSKQEFVNPSTRKYDPHVMSTNNFLNRCDGKATVRILPVKNEHGQNITGKVEETRATNDNLPNNNLESIEKQKIRNKNIINSMNARIANISNVKIEETWNGRAQNADVKVKNDRFSRKSPQQINEIQELVAEIENKISSHTGISSPDKIENTLPPFGKRSLIKTSRNDNVKAYKENRKKKRMPLKVNLAAAFRPVSPERRIKMIPSRRSMKEKMKKKILRCKQNQSPKDSAGTTEAAKLAPGSLNNHTKPYYEAWVDTTLAAVSKNSEKDKLLLENQNLFKKPLTTPELVHDLTDERFMGKIKVRQR